LVLVEGVEMPRGEGGVKRSTATWGCGLLLLVLLFVSEEQPDRLPLFRRLEESFGLVASYAAFVPGFDPVTFALPELDERLGTNNGH